MMTEKKVYTRKNGPSLVCHRGRHYAAPAGSYLAGGLSRVHVLGLRGDQAVTVVLAGPGIPNRKETWTAVQTPSYGTSPVIRASQEREMGLFSPEDALVRSALEVLVSQELKNTERKLRLSLNTTARQRSRGL